MNIGTLSRLILTILSLHLICPTFAAAASPANTTSHVQDNVAVYWGQNTLGYLSNFKHKEKELWWYCNWDSVDIVLLAFMQDFPGAYSDKHNITIPTIRFPHHTDAEFSVNKTAPMHRVAKDIKHCQKKNKKVLLSLGGESGRYGFASEAKAVEFGHVLWAMFGDKPENDKFNGRVPRPFGDVVIDGFDFDIENTDTVGYVPLIETLKSYTNNTNSRLSSKKPFYITAAPQCPYPDQSMNSILTEAHLDKIFVQFYNNRCNANLGDSFNWAEWAQYAQNTSVNPHVELYVGLPGSVNSSSTGYIGNSTALTSVVDKVKGSDSFAGVMIWEASLAFQSRVKDTKQSFPQTIKSILKRQVDNGTATSGARSRFSEASVASLALGVLLVMLVI